LFELRAVELGARLRGVDLAIPHGWTAVLGPSGAGKTSLLEVLAGFARPSRGEVVGAERAGAEAAAVPVYWAPAEGSLWPHLTVREHVAAAAPRGSTAPDAVLEGFGLAALAGRRPSELSAGERDRLRVARAVATGAQALVLDEPFRHVEPRLRVRCWRALHDLGHGGSVVFATHDGAAALEWSESAVVLEDQRVSWAGVTRELYASPQTEGQAWLLGEANWFAEDDGATWLADGRTGCVRPEDLQLEPASDGPLALVDQRRLGPLSRSRLEHRPSGARRHFIHRASAGTLRAGGAVVLRALACVLWCVLTACGGDAGTALTAREIRYHSVPPDGPRQPAPRAVAPAPGGGWLVLDDAGRVLVYGADGSVQRQWSMPETEIGKPEGVAVLRDGRIAVADTHYSRVVVFDDRGTVLAMWGRPGVGPGEFGYPVRLCEGPDGSVYVAEYGGNDRVQRFSPQGDWLGAFGAFGDGPQQFQRPSGLAWWGGAIVVSDALNNRVHRFSPEGDYLGELAGPEAGFDLPYDIAVDADGTHYVVEYGGGCITMLGADGRVLGRFGSPGTGNGQLRTPWGLAAVGAGRVLVADTGNRRLLDVRDLR